MCEPFSSGSMSECYSSDHPIKIGKIGSQLCFQLKNLKFWLIHKTTDQKAFIHHG